MAGSRFPVVFHTTGRNGNQWHNAKYLRVSMSVQPIPIFGSGPTPLRRTWSDFGIDVRGRTSGNVKTLCPKCSHTRSKTKETCLSANVSEGLWECKHCNWAGGLEFGERVGSEKKSVYRRRERREYVLPKLRIPPKEDEYLTADARAMLGARGISEDVAIGAGVYVGRHWFGQHVGDIPALVFPYYDLGREEPVNAKYRPVDPTGFNDDLKLFAQEKDAEPTWYGLQWCIGADMVVIVEGEFDALAFRQAGINSVMSVPAGSPNALQDSYVAKFDFFASGEEVFEQASTVVIAIEDDGPGNIMADEIARRVGYRKCYRASFPEGCKDANDTLIAHGPEALAAVIEQAPHYPYAGITTPLELRQAVLHFKRHGVPPGYGCGMPSLDELYKAVPGQTTIAVGVPTHGKTTVIDTIMLGWAKHNSWPVAIFTPEQYPQEMYMVNLLQKMFKRRFEDLPEEMIERGLIWLDKYVKIIQPDTPTIGEIRERAQFLVKRDGIKALIIDPWTEVASESGYGNENAFIKGKITEIRQEARELGYHLYINTHPRKLEASKDVADGELKTPKPTAYDIMDSSHFANKADTILAIWRNPTHDLSMIEVSVLKARFRRNGRRGTMQFKYHPLTEHIEDAGFVGTPRSIVDKAEAKYIYAEE